MKVFIFKFPKSLNLVNSSISNKGLNSLILFSLILFKLFYKWTYPKEFYFSLKKTFNQSNLLSFKASNSDCLINSINKLLFEKKPLIFITFKHCFSTISVSCRFFHLKIKKKLMEVPVEKKILIFKEAEFIQQTPSWHTALSFKIVGAYVMAKCFAIKTWKAIKFRNTNSLTLERKNLKMLFSNAYKIQKYKESHK